MAALWRIMKAWELDRFDTMALLGEPTTDISAVEWTEDRLLRAAYLIELEGALLELAPKNGIARWIVTPNRGPFFAGNSPLQVLTGSTSGMRDLLRQVKKWRTARHGNER